MFEDGTVVLFFWLAINLALLMAIVAVITGRHLPDGASMRPRAIYLAVAMLPVLVIGVIAASTALNAAMRLLLGPEGPELPTSISDLSQTVDVFTGSSFDPTDTVTRLLVSSIIIAVIALAVYALHRTWRAQLFAEPGFAGSAASRVTQAFAYTTTLVFVAILMFSAYRAGYGVYRIVAPSTSDLFALTETAQREQGIAEAVSGLALAVASWFLLNMHWRLASTLRDQTTGTVGEGS